MEKKGEFYVTGDTHGDFYNVLHFAKSMELDEKDTMIILGDSGINYYVRKKHATKALYTEGNEAYLKEPYNGVIYKDSERSIAYKSLLSKADNTWFIIQGNHEARAENLVGYQKKEWNGGIVYYQKKYPNILFAKDGEIYNFNGKKVFVCGGAYSVDKQYRKAMGYAWFFNEQPDDLIKQRCEVALEKAGNSVDYIMTHTCPYKYLPREMFLAGVDQSTVDNSTEEWFDTIEEKTEYKKWYCGHYHTNKKIDKLTFLFEGIMILGKD